MAVNFQSEEEVKDYLEKIGIEYRFGCFSEKKPEGKPINVIRTHTPNTCNERQDITNKTATYIS